jgi:protoporphyrinogen oxidase
MARPNILILGAGVTGLAAGWASGLPVCEAEAAPGGICSSYYIRPDDTQTPHIAAQDGEAYRFEIGGGHWIFGGDPAVLRFIRTLTPVTAYERRSAVFFPDLNIFVPYPLQNHLAYLGKEIATQALSEMLTAPKGQPHTMAEWLGQSFGPTLTKLFFGPFHERYTAGLWRHIGPQDAYKSPVNPRLAIQGAFARTPPAGYNSAFIYPQEGLNTLAQRLSTHCEVRYGRRVVTVDVPAKEVLFADASCLPYDTLISTLPLNTMMAISGLAVDEPPDPYTSVLVLNIGATRGPECPDDHWLYIPASEAGFHRVGFYSNVDVAFLPRGSRESRDRVSIYVERAYPGGQKPSEADIALYVEAVAQELKQWGWIDRLEVQDPTWIDVAYTWSRPGSRWREKGLKLLEAYNIVQVGRYGRWVFQGIADSLSEGLMVGAALGKRG